MLYGGIRIVVKKVDTAGGRWKRGQSLFPTYPLSSVPLHLPHNEQTRRSICSSIRPWRPREDAELRPWQPTRGGRARSSARSWPSSLAASATARVAVVIRALGHGVVVCLAVLEVVRAWLASSFGPAVLDVAAATAMTLSSGRHRPRVDRPTGRPEGRERGRRLGHEVAVRPSPPARGRRRPPGRPRVRARVVAASATTPSFGRQCRAGARPTVTNREAEARPCRRCAGDQRYRILPVRCASPAMLPTNCV
jgi:hypothetical protein